MPQDDVYKKLRPSTDWFRLYGIDNKNSEDKINFTRRLIGTNDLFDVIRSYIKAQKNSLERSENSEEDFQDAAWSHKQAWRNGYKAGLDKVRAFLPEVNKDHEES